MKEKRLKAIFGLFALCLMLLVVSCALICFVDGRSYTQSAIAQRRGTVVLKRHRGGIFDRSGIPLVEASSQILCIDEDGRLNTSEGLRVASVPVRYGKGSLAAHLIGYTDGDGRGVCGVEKEFDDVLKTDSCDSVSIIKTADGRIMPNSSVSASLSEPKTGSVFLTLDSHIQRIAQDALQSRSVAGAAVVLDAQTFDVLAMASTPDYNQSGVADYLSSDGGELVNRCLMPYNAGSIFKCVTLTAGAACARLRAEYTCSGSLDILGHKFLCNLSSGHGRLGFEDAFALSCNCAFYTMGLDAGASALESTARSLGLGAKHMTDLPSIGESAGNLPTGGSALDCVNRSIGQGEILLTPLQAANMVCIIANEGISREINTVTKTVDRSGGETVFCEKTPPSQVISAASARYTKECMVSAVLRGTGKTLADNPARIAGKTGTAETGWMRDGRTLVHGWFCGYFPYDNPRYAMAVLIEDGGSGAGSAAPVFGEIAQEIIKIYPLG